MMRLFIFFCFVLFFKDSFAQYNWKLEKQKNGINIYLSNVPNSSFKAVKVETTLTGTYEKLIDLLTNIPQFHKWIYKNKESRVLKKNSSLDYVYFSETYLPWPLSNRDAIIHLRINTDSLPRFLSITGTGEPDFFPKIPGKVRVPHYKAYWKVTMPTSSTIKLIYFLEIDPGGSIPAWIANSFADKGPYETFLNLADRLKK
jgi:hypothetical protein